MNMTNQTDVLEMPLSTMEFGIGLLGVVIALASAYLLLKIYKLEKLNVVPRCKIEYQANCSVSGHQSDGKFEFINNVIIENSGGDAEQPVIWFRTVLKNGKILEVGPEKMGRIAKGQSWSTHHMVLIDEEEFENVDEVFCLMRCSDISDNEYFAFSSFKYKEGFKRKAVNSSPRWRWGLGIEPKTERLHWWNKNKVELFINGFDRWKGRYGG